ncbi:MAG: hypothetical protein ABI151_17280 [Chitinophagaceae bacterium]
MSVVACKNDALKDQCLSELEHTLQTEHEFIKVHAAEYLIWLGHPEEVKKEFLKENELHGSQSKYRIGVWRVLAQSETDPAKKKEWIEKVLNAFGDLNGPDRLHAAETLGKLKQSPLAKYPDATEKALHDTSRNLQLYTQWAVSFAPDADTNKQRQQFLQMLASDSNQIVRMISAYILRKNKGLTQQEWTTLAAEALAEPGDSPLKHNLMNTAIVTFPEGMKKPAVYDEIAKEARSNYSKFSVDQRIQLSQALAEMGNEKDIALLTSFLNNENSAGFYEAETKEGADVRAAAAYAILNLKNNLLNH